MGDGPRSPVTVMIEPARRAEMAPLMVAAYGFTDGERRVDPAAAQQGTEESAASPEHAAA